MGPSQICECPFREPRVFTIAHMMFKVLVSADGLGNWSCRDRAWIEAAFFQLVLMNATDVLLDSVSHWLVVWNMNFIFPIILGRYIGNNDPNWQSHIFQRGRSSTNQSLLLTIINHIITMVLTIINSILTIINVHYPKIGTCETLIHITCSARPIGPSQFDHFPSTVWRKFWWRNSYVRLSNPYICPC